MTACSTDRTKDGALRVLLHPGGVAIGHFGRAAETQTEAARRAERGRRGRWLLLSLCLAGAGCTVGRAAGIYTEIPRERTTECQEICTKLDLQMSAVVVVLNTTGCVCEPRTARALVPAAPGVSSRIDPAAAAGAPAARSGGAAIAAAHVVSKVMAQQQHLLR